MSSLRRERKRKRRCRGTSDAERRLMASVPGESRRPARSLRGGGGGVSRFGGVVVRCCVCGGVVTNEPMVVMCSEGHRSGLLHSWCVERWECEA
jgi:hypothetical protein